MANTAVTYQGNGITTDFAITFDYLARKFVRVDIDGTLQTNGVEYNFIDARTISFVSAPAAGTLVTIRRNTSATERIVEFRDASVLKASDLDLSSLQTFHIAEEAKDLVLDTIGTNEDGDLDARFRKIVNLKDGVNPNDAINYGQYTEDREGTYQAALAAKASEVAAKASEVAAKGLFVSSGASLVGYSPYGAGAIATSVQTKLRESISVKDFGAVGDGVTNDTLAFVNALKVGQDVYVPTGTYLLGSFKISGVELFGHGTLKWKGPATTKWITLDNNASISGLTFDGNAYAHSFVTDTSGIYVQGSNCNINNCDFYGFRKYIIFTAVDTGTYGRISNCRFHDSGTIPNSNAVTIGASNWTVTGNHFDGTNWGEDAHMVRLGKFSTPEAAVANVSITGNFFTNPRYTGIVLELHTEDVAISGNTFVNLKQGIKIERQDNTVKRISITGNTFTNLAFETALNLSGDYVVFSGNTVKNINGTLDIGNYGIVSNNYFENQTDATRPCIRQQPLFTGAKITGNILGGVAYDGISLGGLSGEVIGNTVENPGRYGIIITPPAGSDGRFVVNSNRTVGGSGGISLTSAVKNTICEGNNCYNAATNYVMTYNDSWKTNLVSRYNLGWNGRLNTYVIVSDTIEISKSDNLVVVDTEGGAATGYLSTINGADMVGHTITLRSAVASRVVTVKDSTQLRLAGDFVMNSTNDTITLIWTGSQWFEVSRSDNG